jgi:hypothetical protein
MKKEFSSRNNSIIIAHEKGYKVINGEVISPFSGKPRAIQQEDNGRLSFSVRTGVKNGKWQNGKVNVARFVGYKKFGNEIFENDKFVYHKDGDLKNFSEDNICIGTLSEAQMSKKEEVRIAAATKASPKKHDHEKIINMHKEGLSYKQIMTETGIKSKGTISFIINNSIENSKSNDK